ncbi:PorP/SprF family type IX secretion system membrane protein [Thermonema rossianum]|uniref:PorP/SprF family type IX secretion system membrane protein n=1 Tax=Thermonema rossianum TaxID=55505 RepID=UPI00068F28F0|nr:type IX secretion system membrane protein PorP/SprF [Thermonema rossianum]
MKLKSINMKTIMLSALLLAGWGSLRAQQDAMFTQYMFNMLAINPAYAGSHDVVSFTGLFRKQWVGIEGAPTTATLSADFPLWNERLGGGVNIVHDQIGVMQTTGLYASYAYRIKFSEKARLSMGLQAGMSYFVANYQDAQSTNYYDPALASNVTRALPNVGAGLWYHTDKFFAGFSVPHLLNNSLTENQSLNAGGADEARQYRHYFFTTGYVFDLSPVIKLKPWILAKSVEGAPLQFDLNANVWFHERVGVGVSYRSGDSVDGLFQFQLNNQWLLGYAYDYTLSNLGRYNTGSHELMLRYQFSTKKDKIISPRFF